MGFPKKSLSEDEVLVLVLRPHVKTLAGPILLFLLVVPAATFLAAIVPEGSVQSWLRGVIVLAALAVLVRWTFWPFLVWWNTIYAVTSRRLVMRSGVFNRSGHDMPLTRLNDVSFEHTLFQRMLGCGTLVVESAGEHGQVTLVDIPKVERVQRTLYRLSDDARTSATGRAQTLRADVDDALESDDLPQDPVDPR